VARWITIIKAPFDYRWPDRSAITAFSATGEHMVKDEIADFLPPHTRETKNEFSRCRTCGKIFWRGSHHARMLGWIRALENEMSLSPDRA